MKLTAKWISPGGIHVRVCSRMLAVGFLFIAALGIRLYNVNQPVIDFHATRQYRSFLIARDFYYETSQSIPDWKKQVARISRERQGTNEPPIVERVVAVAYSVCGREHLWIPQLLSICAWMIGGGFLYHLAKKVASPDAALFSTAFYLLLPFAIVASRSFQPDPLMVMMLLISVSQTVHYYERPSRLTWGITATVSALSIFIKPHCLFVIWATFVSLHIWKRGLRKSIISRRLWGFLVLTILPTISFYIYGMLTATSRITGEAQKIALLPILIDPFFWKGWFNNIWHVIGLPALVGALLGVIMFRHGLPRVLLFGMWTGYLMFGLAFNYNVATHNYYQLQFIPIVALSLGPIGALIIGYLRDNRPQWYWRVATWSIFLFAVFLSLLIARGHLLNSRFERSVRVAEEIGERVEHSTQNIFLSFDYGVPLEYHGVLSGVAWPIAADLEWGQLAGYPELDAEERFNAWFSKDSPEYFIIIDLQEFEQQPDLKRFLTENYSMIAQKDDYLIFDLRRK